MNWLFFRFLDRYDVAVEKGGLEPFLRQHLEGLQIPEGQARPQLEVVRSRFPWGIPSTARISHGIYKGIPWRIGLQAGSPTRVYFFTPAFFTFLMLRKVLIPFLRREIIRDGGAGFIGSAFRDAGKVYVLFGHPGCGKTRVLLSAAAAGASFIGDHEIVIFPDGSVYGLFHYLELRLETVRKSKFWKQLRLLQKSKLFLFEMISAMTFRRICFNILVQPETLEIPRSASDSTEKIFIHLAREHQSGPIGKDVFMEALQQYAEIFTRYFGRLFEDESMRQREKENFEKILADSWLWQLPESAAVAPWNEVKAQVNG